MNPPYISKNMHQIPLYYESPLYFEKYAPIFSLVKSTKSFISYIPKKYYVNLGLSYKHKYKHKNLLTVVA